MAIQPSTIGRTATMAVIALVLGAFSFRCGPPNPTTQGRSLTFQAVDSAFRTAPDLRLHIPSPVYDHATNEIKLTCARNETVSFYLVLQPQRRACHSLTISADPLRGNGALLDVSSIKFFRALPVDVGRLPGWHIKATNPSRRQREVIDILVPVDAPVNGQPYTVKAGNQLLIWVDVVIPSSVKPGKLFSEIRINESGREIARLPLMADVQPFELPDDPGVALLGPVNLQRLLGHHLRTDGEPFVPNRVVKNAPLYDESVAVIRQTLRLLQQHRVSPFLTGLYPIKKLDDRGEMVVRWGDYDELIGDFLDGKMYPKQPRVRYWPIPMDETFPRPPHYDALSSPNYTKMLREYLTLCYQHFAERGWADRAFVLLPPPEQPYTSKVFHDCRSYAEIVRLAEKKLSVVALLPPQDLRPYGWDGYPWVDLSGRIDTWCPPAQFFDPDVFAQPKFRNARKWLQLDRPPFSGSISLAGSDTDARVIPWQAARLGAEAVLLPETNNWTDDYDIRSTLEQMSQVAPPLILPGRLCGLDAPLPTVRLKMLRRGMQDLAYLQLCRERGLQRTAAIIQRSLCRFAGAEAYGAHFEAGRFDSWCRDPFWWSHARLLMAAALSDRPANAADPAKEPLDSIAWQRFLEATQQVTIRADGVRVSLRPGEGGAPGSIFDVDVLLTIQNLTSKPISARVSFQDFPVGWQPESGHAFVSAIKPYGSQAVALRASARALPAGDDGKMNLSIAMEVDAGETTTHAVQLSHLTARRPNKPIVIDGDLTDWPMAVGNVARNFTSIDVRTAPAESSTDPQPPSQNVLAWVCADDHYLYFAFHCITSRKFVHPAAQRNFIMYDDRIPVGEELLEILIDPSNGRSSSPADIFHLAIKPTGAVLQERGIRTDPQVGSARHWPAEILVATSVREDRWVAEVRVPLKDFGPGVNRRQSWAINFCRFDLAAWSYSTWSGAAANVYDPSSFGNLSFAN